MRAILCILAVGMLAAVCFGQVASGGDIPVVRAVAYDDSASTPVIPSHVRHDTVPDGVDVKDQSFWIHNIKQGDRLVVLIQRYKDKGNHRNNKCYALDDHCSGTDGLVYKSTVNHTSRAATKPITGADWATRWEFVSNNKLDSIKYVLKDTTTCKDLDARVLLDFHRKPHNYDSTSNQ